MRKYPIISILMILLIITMPISFADIISYKISGNESINKVVRNQDTLNVEALVNIVGDNEISPDQVWLGSTIQFDSCVKDINGYLCKLKFPAAGKRTFSEKEPYVINLHNDNHANPPTSYSLVGSESGYIVVDFYPPRVALGKKKSGDKMIINFKANDASYSPYNYDECAGIKTINFYTADKKLDQIFDYAENQCSAEDSFEFDIAALEDGFYTIYIESIDYINNKRKQNYTFEVDKTGAFFSDLRLMDKAGNEVTHIAAAVIDAVVIVDTSIDTEIDTIRADLSSLNEKESYSGLKGDCVSQGDIISCTWNVKISPDAFGSKDLIFKAEDDAGNYNEQTISRLIQRDIDGPRAAALKTEITGVNNTNYLRSRNNIIEVSFSESGVGLDPEDVLLDLSNLGGPKNLKADSCEQARCIWQDLNFAMVDGRYTIAVNPNTQDRLGNKLKEPFSAAVVIDTTPPQIIDIEIRTIGSGTNTYEGFTTYGDSYDITAKVYESDILVDASGDFSAAISDAADIQADDCEDLGEGIWECRWMTDTIDIVGYINGKLKFTFRDFAGNRAEFERSIVVYGILEGYEDHWSHSVTCSPSKIDRQVAALIDQRVYCHINLEGDANILDLQLGDCTGNKSIKYVRKQELMNNQRFSQDPYIRLTLHSAEIEDNTLDVSCPIFIISQTGNYITSIPEIEEVKISIPFYNPPLGEYGKNMEKKIDDAVDDAEGTWEIVTTLNNIMHYAEFACSLITTINNVATLFNTIGNFKGILSKALSANPVTVIPSQALEQSRKADQTVTSVLNNNMKKSWIGNKDGQTGFVNKFCKFISCRLFYDDTGWGSEDGILHGIGTWQRGVLKYANLAATGGTVGEKIGLGGQGVNAYTYEKDDIDEHGAPSTKVLLQGGKLNPKDSIVLSFATLCLPGIVYNLDKYRQIKCMYADCLQTSVDTGVPVSACEDLKEYHTCKYWAGEVFQLAPFTGLIDYFVNLVKGALSSPFGFIDIALGYVCTTPINTPYGHSVAKMCLIQEMSGMIADVWSDIANIKDDWEINTDYCANMGKSKSEEKADDKSSGGLFS